MVSIITRNITSQFVKIRAQQKNKKHRFGYSILLGGIPTSSSAQSAAGDGIRASGDSTGQQRLLTASTEDETHRNPSESSPGGMEVEMTARLPPLWVDLVGEAQDSIAKLKDKMSALQKAEQRRLWKVFSSSDDTSTSTGDKEIDNLTQQITKLFHHCESRVQQIQSKHDATHVSASEYTLKKNAQRSIATQLQQLSQQFRAQQKHYLSELRKRKAGADPYGLESQPSKAGSEFDVGFSNRLMMELDTMEAGVDQRNEEIGRIASSVAELHGIFKDLSVLVIDQGTILDRIDYNVEQVVTQTQQATVHISKAEQHQKSARAGAVVGFLVVAIVILIILWILKHTL
eukprot:Selendium_serpulae@DN5527_c0_g1_i10.p2